MKENFFHYLKMCKLFLADRPYEIRQWTRSSSSAKLGGRVVTAGS